MKSIQYTFQKFGDFLKLKREELGISQHELAKKVGIDRTYLSMLENRGNPAFNKVKEIANALNITLEEFFKTEPREANRPIIKVVFQETPEERRLSERMITGFTIVVPIVTNIKALRTKIIEDADIHGYVLYDESLFSDVKDKTKLIAYKSDEFPKIRCTMIDLNQRTLEHDGVFFIIYNGEVTIRKVNILDEGILLTAPQETEVNHLTIVPNKKKETVEVLGKVLSFNCRV